MDSSLRSSNTRVRDREDEEEEYLRFRAILMVGELRLLRKELVHVLYKLYIKLLRTQISKIASKREDINKDKVQENVHAILKYKRDFLDIPAYAEELQYIEPVLKDMPDIESMKNDKQLAKIFTSSKFQFRSNTFRFHAVFESVHLRNFVQHDGKIAAQISKVVVVRSEKEEASSK